MVLTLGPITTSLGSQSTPLNKTSVKLGPPVNRSLAREQIHRNGIYSVRLFKATLKCRLIGQEMSWTDVMRLRGVYCIIDFTWLCWKLLDGSKLNFADLSIYLIKKSSKSLSSITMITILPKETIL